jgi:flagellar hook-length control protein FliK
MNNGQLNTVSVPSVTLLVAQESTAPAALLDGGQQNGGDFAGLLSGVQLLAKENKVPELRHVAQLLFKTGKDQTPLDAAENSVVDLLAQNYVSPAIIALPQSAGPQTKDPEKTDVNSDAAPLQSELPDVTSRMVMAAYSQPGRMPEVNLLTPLPVDVLQNVATASGSPVVIPAPAVKIHTEQAAAALMQDSQPFKPAATRAERPVATPAAEQNQHPHQNKAAEFGLPAEASAVAAEEVLFSPHSSATMADVGVKEVHSLQQVPERETISAIPIIAVPEPKTAITPQNASSDRTSEVNKLTQPPVDRLQNVAAASKQPPVDTAPAVKISAGQVAAASMQEPPAPQRSSISALSMPQRTLTAAEGKSYLQPQPGAKRGDSETQVVRMARPVPYGETSTPVRLSQAVDSKADTALKPVTADRMSEVSKLTQPHVDSLQSEAAEAELPVVTAAPAAKAGAAQFAAETSEEAALLKPASIMVENTVAHHAVEQNQPLRPEAGGFEPIEKGPEAAVATVGEVSPRPQVQVSPADTGVREVPQGQSPLDVEVITSVRRAVFAEPVTASPLQQDSSVRKSDVNKSTQLSADTLQHVTDAAASKPAAIFTALSEKTAATPAVSVPIQALHEQTSVSLSEPLTAATELHQPEPSSNQPSTPAVALPLESELDIQLSQPRPVTVRATAAAALADTSTASVVQEARGVRQRLTAEQQNEKVRAGVEQGIVKEVAPLLQTALSASDPTFGSSSSEGDSKQELPDGTAVRNQMQGQDMQGQLGVGHQKVSSATNKSVSTESAGQAIPEQVMQQVKERLVQHEVKAGNQQITLTLSPDSLGELKMNLNLQGQKLSVEIITESRSVRDAIVQHTDALKESLARQNITMDSFDVTTGGKGSGNQGPNQNAWRELARQQQQQQLWTSPRGYNTAQADLPAGQGAYPKQPGHSMLDIHY